MISLLLSLIIGMVIVYFTHGSIWSFLWWSSGAWVVVVIIQGLYTFYTGHGNMFKRFWIFCQVWAKSIRTGLKLVAKKETRELLTKPKTFEQAVEAIILSMKNINEDDRDYLLAQPSSHQFAATVHHTMGRKIRNAWELWNKESALHKDISEKWGLWHADDMSGIILQCAYDKMKGNRWQPQVYADSYKSYWAMMDMEKKHKDSISRPIGRGKKDDTIVMTMEQLRKEAEGDEEE